MLGIETRTLRIVWTIFLFAAAIALVYAIRGALVTFTLALFLALVLSPLVTFVDRYTSIKLPRTVSLAAVYVALLVIFGAVIIAVATAVSSDARSLSSRLPQTLDTDSLATVPLPHWLEPVRDRLFDWLRDRVDEIGQNALTLMGRALQELASGLGAVVSAIIIPILAFFFIKDARSLRDGLIQAFDRRHQVFVHGVLNELQILLSQYLRALVILSVFTFISYSVFLSLTGARYALLLAGVAAVLEFIPAVGPFVGAVLIQTVGLFSGYPHWILLLVFLAIYRLVQDYVFQPMLLSAGMRIHPLLIIFGALAGGEIAGIVGVFFSVPVIAAARLVVNRIRQHESIEVTD